MATPKDRALVRVPGSAAKALMEKRVDPAEVRRPATGGCATRLGGTMQFSVGDKVVHPHHGPGTITGLERKEFLDGKKLYYEIEIPMKSLSVYLPRAAVEGLGVRLAMSRARLPRVLDRLKSEPRRLPGDYKVRQEQVWERLRTGRVMRLAEVMRDLTWHGQRDHLTKKDAEYLNRAKDRLAAELALVREAEVADMEKIIEDSLSAGVWSTLATDQSPG